MREALPAANDACILSHSSMHEFVASTFDIIIILNKKILNWFEVILEGLFC